MYISAPVNCAPPANKPTPDERDACRPWLARELELLWPGLRVGGGARRLRLGRAVAGAARRRGVPCRRGVPAFGHGVEAAVDGRTVLGCYHVSQQNTFTGRLTEPMLDAVFTRAKTLAS